MPRLHRYQHLSLALLTACVLAACGGGDGDDGAGGGTPPPPDAGGGGTVLVAGVPGLVGDWLENGCAATGFQSFKRLVRATQLSASSITYSEGVVTYGSTNCSGAGSTVGPSRLGDVVFSRSESNARVAANWGEFTTVTNTRFGAIWAKKSETVLCLLGDQRPSVLPTLANVEASLQTLPDLGCFTKR
jgi:hypothetical protein